MPDSDNAYNRIFSEVKHLCNLEIENGKLLLTEKLTLLIGKITLTAVVFIMATAAMIFISMGVAHLLLRCMSPWATYVTVGGFYVAIAVIAAVFRRQLIIDPIARYISRVILDPPSKAGAPGKRHVTSYSNSSSNEQPEA